MQPMDHVNTDTEPCPVAKPPLARQFPPQTRANRGSEIGVLGRRFVVLGHSNRFPPFPELDRRAAQE
jgi:hypothetical protein